jgi:acetolactate synthase-1/2/3 large subunit
MLLLVGQVERSARGREAFQELDYRAFFGGAVKWVTEIDDARRIRRLAFTPFPQGARKGWGTQVSG